MNVERYLRSRKIKTTPAYPGGVAFWGGTSVQCWGITVYIGVISLGTRDPCYNFKINIQSQMGQDHPKDGTYQMAQYLPTFFDHVAVGRPRLPSDNGHMATRRAKLPLPGDQRPRNTGQLPTSIVQMPPTTSKCPPYRDLKAVKNIYHLPTHT